MKFYHVQRDYKIPLALQKKQLASEFLDFVYIMCNRNVITFMASGKKAIL